MTESSTLVENVRALNGASVLCVGDVMLDRYVYGAVSRVSPEAPIPICRVADERSMLGGAGNVVRNLIALGANVDFVAVVGDDAAGEEIGQLVGDLAAVTATLFEEPGRRTTVKTRYIADGQQLLRADHETETPISSALRSEAYAHVRDVLTRVGAVVLSDYGKGMLGEHATAQIIDAAQSAGKPVIVDPKGPSYERYRGATLITPNRHELAEATRSRRTPGADVVDGAREIIETCGIASVLVTRGPDGMTYVDADTEIHLPVQVQEVFDVSGAGDTVVAAVAAAYAVGIDPIDAARIANTAAGLVVGKTGTAVANADEVVDAVRARDLSTGEQKSVSIKTALERIATWRSRGLSIGFTNGCFDLIHPGHVSLLHQARDACDRLVVGLNSDRSTRRLKGAERPVQSEAARAAVLGSLATVDLIVIFDDDTPVALIEATRPDILVKGADYSLEQVVGSEIVQSYGGKVLLAEIVPGHSTTATIAKLGTNT